MKVQDDTAYIRALISEGEHVRQDFKFEISDSRKIARSLSAFANTEGGRLLIGVKDNGRIAGVRSEEEMYMVEAAAQVYCIPAVEVDMRVYRPEGRSVLVASVGPAVRKPVTVKEEDGSRLAYVRIADENILATAVHIGAWKCAADSVPSKAVSFTHQEKSLLDIISSADTSGMTLSQICRRVTIPRRRVIDLLSHFVHWDLVEFCHDSHGFRYRAV
ncbi:MAG TPA: ATP-binding protein [Candidatus Coprenecus pullistercoris]|nr:ATP-binding protein [Candidatus Coprenecus pullistercoris]